MHRLKAGEPCVPIVSNCMLSRKDILLRSAETKPHGHRGGLVAIKVGVLRASHYHGQVLNNPITFPLHFHWIPLYSTIFHHCIFSTRLCHDFLLVPFGPWENSPFGTWGPQGKILSHQPQQPEGPRDHGRKRIEFFILLIFPITISGTSLSALILRWNLGGKIVKSNS